MATIVLTATVTPNVTDFVNVADPGTRLQQYRDAIASWQQMLSSSPHRLVIVETSGADPDSLLSLVPVSERDSITVVHHTADAAEIKRGKGAIELASIGRVLSTAGIGDRTVFKATGRLTLRNAKRLVVDLPASTVRCRMTLDRSWIDTRLLGASDDLWLNEIVPAGALVSDATGTYAEHAVAARLAYAATLGAITLTRFPERPQFDGHSGSTGRAYSSRLSRAKDKTLRPIESVLHGLARNKQT